MASGPQFIALDGVEPDGTKAADGPLTIAELRTLMAACPNGDSATKARYADMLARASGLYANQQQDGPVEAPAEAVVNELCAWLLPELAVVMPSVSDAALRGAVARALGVAGVGDPQGTER